MPICTDTSVEFYSIMIYIYLFNFRQGPLEINGENFFGWKTVGFMMLIFAIVYFGIIILLCRKDKRCQAKKGEGKEKNVIADTLFEQFGAK